MSLFTALANLLSSLGKSNDGSDTPTGMRVRDDGDHNHVTAYSGRQDVRVSFDEDDKGVRKLHSTDQKPSKK
ncbi:MAG: hypothetical protein KGL39_13530 [Patescibacteria group bacterium]|nr:hypothetical protein [Patescibacteria group bacterium]